MLSRCRIACLVVVVVLTGSLAPVRAQSGRRAVPPSRSLLERYNLEKLWLSHTVIDSSRDVVTNLVLDEETVYVQTRNGFLTAIDSETGSVRWTQLLARIDTPQFPVTSNDNTVLVNAGMLMFAVDKWTGSERWRIRLPEQAGASPAIDDERVYLATGGGSVYSYELDKIYELYRQNKLPKWGFQAQLWRHKTSKPIAYSPLTHGGQVTFASRTKSIYSVNAADDSLIFQMETPEQVIAPMNQVDNKLFVSTENQRMYCFDARTGVTNWIFVSKGDITNKPILLNNRCYVSPSDGTLYCLSLETGLTLWEQKGAETLLAQTENYVVSQDYLGNVLLISPDEQAGSSRIVARLPLRDYSVRVENEVTDRVILASPSGAILCLQEKGSGFPKFFKNPDKRPIEPLFTDEENTATDPASTQTDSNE